MPKKKNLNGIPHNIVKSYFSTLRYYDSRYMADWLYYTAKELNIKEAILDIYSCSITPKELEIYPLVYHLAKLKDIVSKELKNNGFTEDHFETAVIKIQFQEYSTYKRVFYCTPILIDKKGNELKVENILEQAYEDEFGPFKRLPISNKKEGIISQIKSFFLRRN